MSPKNLHHNAIPSSLWKKAVTYGGFAMKRTTLVQTLILAAILSLTTLCIDALPAAACGGMFCAVPAGPTPPQPVDQNAERIIFEVNDDDTITAHVQIQYMGRPENFAWVVPVPSVPDVEDGSDTLFNVLDQQTQLQVQLPIQEPCDFANSDEDSSCSPGCAAADSTAASGFDQETPAPNGPVKIYATGETDSYEFSVIGAEQTSDLIDWLQNNNYNVSDNMTPVMDVYNGNSMKFLALKLRAGQDSDSIAPIKMTYEGTEPMIPIKGCEATAVSWMGIIGSVPSPHNP